MSAVPDINITSDYTTTDNLTNRASTDILGNSVNHLTGTVVDHNNGNLTFSVSNSELTAANGIIKGSESNSTLNKSLALEPNPFEQSFAQKEEVILSQSQSDLLNKNKLIGSIDKRLIKPQSDTQLANLRLQQQQQQQQNQNQQLQQQNDRSGLPQQGICNSEPPMGNNINSIKSDSLIPPGVRHGQQMLNYNSMSPPVLTPGGSKRGALNVLPPLNGFLSPGGSSLVATPGIWNSIFPPTPGIPQQQQAQILQQQHQQQQQQQQQQLPSQQNVLNNNVLSISNLGQSFNKQELQQQENKNYLNSQNNIVGLQQTQVQIPSLTQQQQQQAQEIANKNLEQAQKQIQEAKREVEIHSQVLAAAQAQVQAVRSQNNLANQNQPVITSQIQTNNPQHIELPQSQTQSQTAMENEITNINKSLMNTDPHDITVQLPLNNQQQNTQQNQLMNLFFDAKRSGLTPNESSLRTGLTPGPGGIIGNNNLYSYLGMPTDSFTPLGGTNNKPPLSTGLSGLIVPTLNNLDVNSVQVPNKEQESVTDNTATSIIFNKDTESSINESETTTPGLTMKDLPHPDLNIIKNENNDNTSINDTLEIPSSKTRKRTASKNNVDVKTRTKRNQKITSTNLTKETKRQKTTSTSTIKESDVKISPSSSDVATTSTTTTKRSKKKAQTEEEKRQMFLERNRLAASKCRQRKKNMIENMKHELTQFKTENESLREQVSILREHALTLRTILYGHRECSLLTEQVGGVESLNAILNATNYVSQLPEAHQEPESNSTEDVSSLLNGNTNTQAAVAAAVAHTTNKAIERSNN